MKNKYLLKLKEEEAKREGEICRVKIEENIINVEAGKELTMPLAVLNKNCDFRNMWNKFNGIDNEKKANLKEYRQIPEVKERLRAYQREYQKKPEVVAKRREYYSRPEVKARLREYMNRPEIIAKRREYFSRPEVKAKMKEYNAEYKQRPEIVAKIKERNEIGKEKLKAYARNYYLTHKAKILAQRKLNYKKKLENV